MGVGFMDVVVAVVVDDGGDERCEGFVVVFD